MNPLDLVNSVNGSLKGLSTILIVLGALQVQAANYIGGGILMVAGFACAILYEYAPDKPTTAVTTTTNVPSGTVSTTTINPIVLPSAPPVASVNESFNPPVPTPPTA